MTPSAPLITILTDTKNRSKLISRCIESIQKQTYQNYEHIIADAGDDDTEQIVKAYNDPKIKYIRVQEGGPVAQTRASFQLSKGEFITFLDDDDEYLPEKLEKQLALFKTLTPDYGFIYGSMSYYDNDTGQYLYEHKAEYDGGKELLPIAVARPVICGTPTLMFRRDAFESIGGTWVSGIGNERSDWALACLALKKGWKVAPLRESLNKIYVNHQCVRMSSPSFYKDNSYRYILFHNYFLEEYADVIRDNPSASEPHYDALMHYYVFANQYVDALAVWRKLLKIRIRLRYVFLLPYCIIKKNIRNVSR